LDAIADFDKGGILHSFRDSTGYDLQHDGKRYPPKAIIGLAARRLAGRVLDPNEFSGGQASRCFSILRQLGFEVVPKQNPSPTELPEFPTPRVWVETTKSEHKHGGVGWEFGSCLWSPSRAVDGKDWYSTLRDVQPGDIVIHSNDSTLSGFSRAIAGFAE